MDDPVEIANLPSSPYDCTILVHPTIHRLERALDDMIHARSLSVLDVGKELGKFLLDVPQAERTRAIRHWFEHQIDESEPGPLVCKHIDFLFLPIMDLDPFVMFRQASRRTKLFVLWPGEWSGKTLAYAVPGHNHYRTWEVLDSSTVICRLDD